ncbi:hypothetical protein HDV00_007603 [Rhizophlyctis rosea]|nr:hypothetical protein HDV00_007603 [Rhizophlyctis rosea]
MNPSQLHQQQGTLQQQQIQPVQQQQQQQQAQKQQPAQISTQLSDPSVLSFLQAVKTAGQAQQLQYNQTAPPPLPQTAYSKPNGTQFASSGTAATAFTSLPTGTPLASVASQENATGYSAAAGAANIVAPTSVQNVVSGTTNHAGSSATASLVQGVSQPPATVEGQVPANPAASWVQQNNNAAVWGLHNWPQAQALTAQAAAGGQASPQSIQQAVALLYSSPYGNIPVPLQSYAISPQTQYAHQTAQQTANQTQSAHQHLFAHQFQQQIASPQHQAYRPATTTPYPTQSLPYQIQSGHPFSPQHYQSATAQTSTTTSRGLNAAHQSHAYQQHLAGIPLVHYPQGYPTAAQYAAATPQQREQLTQQIQQQLAASNLAASTLAAGSATPLHANRAAQYVASQRSAVASPAPRSPSTTPAQKVSAAVKTPTPAAKVQAAQSTPRRRYTQRGTAKAAALFTAPPQTKRTTEEIKHHLEIKRRIAEAVATDQAAVTDPDVSPFPDYKEGGRWWWRYLLWQYPRVVGGMGGGGGFWAAAGWGGRARSVGERFGRWKRGRWEEEVGELRRFAEGLVEGDGGGGSGELS